MFGKSRCGFTLVELLVVVAIIALLLSILLPALGKARDQAYAVRSLSNLRHLSLTMAMYASENDQWLADWRAITRNPKNNDPPAYMKRAYHWSTKHGLFAEGGYIMNYQYWLDPHDGGIRQFLGTAKAYTRLEPVPDGETHEDRRYYTFSYTMTGHLQNQDTPGASTTSWHAGSTADMMTNFQSPSQDMVFGEENTGHEQGTVDALDYGLSYGPPVINDGGFNNDYTEPRHIGDSQAGFLDGSARRIPAGFAPMAQPKRGKYNEWNRNYRFTPAP